MTGNLCRSIAAVALAGLIALAPVAPVYGQNQGQAPNPGTVVSVGPDYTKPKPPVWNFLAPYAPIHLPQPQYTNGPKLQQMVRGGKLSLSVQDAVELALENNPDIAVQRYFSWIAEADILRSKGGGAQRGVANVVTTAQAFANVPTLSYDPSFLMAASLDSKSAPANTLIAGSSTLSAPFAHTETANFQYNQAFHTGTAFSLTLSNSRSTSTASNVFFNPLVQSTGTFSAVQPLLNGFGLLPNERYIRIALITKKVVDYAFQQSLITDLTAVEDDYWELVFARGNVVVQQEAVDEAQQLLDQNRRQVQVGTLAPIEVVRAEAQLATAQQGLITAQTAQLQEQIVLMSVISKDPNAPELRGVEILPTDTMQNPPQIEDIPLTQAVNEATQNRPDVLESKTNIDADDINVRATRNALLPTLNLSAFVSSVGVGGNSKTLGTPLAVAGTTPVDSFGTTTPILVDPSGSIIPVELGLSSLSTPVTGMSKGGAANALGQMLSARYPEFEAQISLTLPIRNRVNQADSVRAILTDRQDQAKYQQVVNAATVDVQNAQITLRQDRAVVIASQKARELQEATLDSDQKKLQVGATTNFVVVTDQQNLAAARSAEVRAQANLEEARVNFERAMGRTLVAKRVTIADAKAGASPRDTLIPGTKANGEIVGLKEALASMPNGPGPR